MRLNLQKLEARRDELKEELSEIRQQITGIKTRENLAARAEREKEKRKKLFASIRRRGGREAFIKEYGQGQDIYTELTPGYCTYWYWSDWWRDECQLLGVEPNREQRRCLLKASRERDGMAVCQVHARRFDESLRFRMEIHQRRDGLWVGPEGIYESLEEAEEARQSAKIDSNPSSQVDNPS